MGAQRLIRLLFANVITALETYLSDTFINRVIKDKDLLQAYIDEEPKFKDRKVSYRNVLREASKVEQEARAEMHDTVGTTFTGSKHFTKRCSAEKSLCTFIPGPDRCC